MEPSNLPPAEVITAWLIAAGSFIAAIVATWKPIAEWVQSRWNKRHDDRTIDVELAKVKVSEKEAENHEVQVLFAGYDALLAASDKRAESAEKSAQAAHDRIEQMRIEANDRMTAMEMRMSRSENINYEMTQHIRLLESMVPTPPGPPARPDWHLR